MKLPSLLGFAVFAASLAWAQAPKPPSNAELTKAMDAVLAPLIKEDKFSGAVLIAKDGKPIYRKAAGFAHFGHRVKNNIDTKFCLASTGKMFTAVAIAQLVDAGKLSYEDTVGKIDPSFPSEEIRQKVKVKHLLTHTSGVQDIFTDEFFNGARDHYRDLADYMPLFQTKPLEFEPGSKEQYSNGGFCLLGYLVEKASGMPYWDYVRKHIYEPAGMKDSGPFEMDIDTPNLAYGYTLQTIFGKPYPDGKRRNNLFTHSIKGSPAGGSFSTVGDMVRFGEALKSGKLLSRAGFETLTSPKTPVKNGGAYGYGFAIRELNGEKIIGHSGGFLGIGSMYSVYLKSGYTVSVLSNYDEGADVVAAAARKAILGG